MNEVNKTCPACKKRYWILESDEFRRKLSGDSWYCPHCGDGRHYGKPTIDTAIESAVYYKEGYKLNQSTIEKLRNALLHATGWNTRYRNQIKRLKKEVQG